MGYKKNKNNFDDFENESDFYCGFERDAINEIATYNPNAFDGTSMQDIEGYRRNRRNERDDDEYWY